MLSSTERDLLNAIYWLVRGRGAPIIAREQLAELHTVNDVPALESLLRQGYLIEAYGTLMLSAKGIEVAVGLSRD